MTIAIERAQVGYILALMGALSGRALQYNRQRCIDIACQMDEPARTEFLSQIEQVFEGMP